MADKETIEVATKDLEQDREIARLRADLKTVKHHLEISINKTECGFEKKISDTEKAIEESRKLDPKLIGVMATLGIFFYGVSTTAIGFYSNSVIFKAVTPVTQEATLIKNGEAALRRDVDKLEAAQAKFMEKTNEDIGNIKGEIGDTLDIEQLEGRFEAQVIQVSELGGRFSRIIEDRIQPRLDKMDESMLRIMANIDDADAAELQRYKRESDKLRNELEQARIDLVKEAAD